jgi:hypothetical protein
MARIHMKVCKYLDKDCCLGILVGLMIVGAMLRWLVGSRSHTKNSTGGDNLQHPTSR